MNNKELVFSGDISFNEIIKLIKNNTGNSPEKKIKVAIIGTTSIQFFTQIFRYVMKLRGFDCDIYESEYDGINMSLLDNKSDLFEFSPEFIIILPYYTDIKVFPTILADDKSRVAALEECMIRERAIWDNLSAISNVQVFQCNYVVPYIKECGSYEDNTLSSKNNFLRLLNMEIIRQKPSFVTVIDLDAVSAEIGKKKWFDSTAYFTTKQGFAVDYILNAVNPIARLIQISKGAVKKCLVLDLDNTLWGDVVGDVGANHVILDPNDPEGEAYRSFQMYVKALRDRGVILAVCSKNDEEIAKEPFINNPNMVLRLEDISCFIANWDDKATNIARIAKELNIGTDSLVFFDDNPAERDIVRAFLPEVQVIDVPDNVDDYIAALYKCGAFDTIKITEEDMDRSNSYYANQMRRFTEKKCVDFDAYLTALEMEAEISEVNSTTAERFVQLINKSNQFNLRTVRYSEKQIKDMMLDSESVLFTVKLRDKFGYYGVIACVILRFMKDECFIDTWVMSCRVLKRGVEDITLNAIGNFARIHNAKTIKGEYIRTDRNSMVSDLYDRYSFKRIESNGTITRYTIDTDDIKALDTHIRINTEKGKQNGD